MNKKRLIGVVLASFAMGVGGLLAVAPKKTMKAEALNETLTTNFQQLWTDMGGAGTANSSGEISVGSTPVTGKFYKAGVESDLFNFTITKNAHTPKVRWYSSKSSYFVVMPYCEEANLTTTGPSHVKINKLGDYKIKSISVPIRADYGANPVFAVGSTYDSTQETAFNWADKTGSYTFATPVDELFVYCGGRTSNDYAYLLDMTITVVKGNTLTFDTQGGSVVDSQYLVADEHPVKPADPTKASVGTTAYEFDGWWTTADNSGSEVDFTTFTISEATTIYAHWSETSASTVTLSFESNGGSTVNPIEVTYGAVASKPADPTKPTHNDVKYYYEFKGWYTDDKLTTAFDWTQPVYETATLYAKWSFKLRDNAPAGRTHYTINNNIATWKSNYNPTEDSTYYYNTDVTLNSVSTFGGNSKPELNMRIVAKDSDHGFFVRKSNPGVRNSTIYVTPADPSKVITYLKLVVSQWGSHDYQFALYKNNDAVASDTETLSTTSGDSRYVEATFAASDRVTSVKLDMPNTIMVLQDMYVAYGDHPDYAAALQFATDFNDAAVCGATDDAGLDETKWETQATAFGALDESVQNYLTNCEITTGEFGEMLERYDRVIQLHGVGYDFMGRVAAGKIVLSPAMTPSIHVDSGLIIIVATITVASLAIGLFVIIKRQKRA